MFNLDTFISESESRELFIQYPCKNWIASTKKYNTSCDWANRVGNCRGKVPGNGTTRAIGSVHRKECNASFSGPWLSERCVTATRETYFSLSGVTNNLCTTLFKASLALAGSLRNSSVDLALASSRCIRQLEPPSEEGYC